MTKVFLIGGSECVKNGFLMTQDIEKCDVLIVNYLSNDLLVKTALGFDTVVLKAFLLNKRVYFTKNCFEYKKTKNKEIYKLYEKYKTFIENFGLEYINDSDDIKRKPEVKKIITNNDLLNTDQKIFVIDKKSIITPLAQDTAREKNITFIRK